MREIEKWPFGPLLTSWQLPAILVCIVHTDDKAVKMVYDTESIYSLGRFYDHFSLFLDVTSHLCKRVCPSARPYVHSYVTPFRKP